MAKNEQPQGPLLMQRMIDALKGKQPDERPAVIREVFKDRAYMLQVLESRGLVAPGESPESITEDEGVVRYGVMALGEQYRDVLLKKA